MAIVGRSSVLVSPSFSGFQTQVGKAAAGSAKTFGDQMAKGSPKIGAKLASGIGKVFKAGAVSVGAAAGAGLGYALVKGFKRLEAIDNARAKLVGLGHSTKAVDGIMNDALKSVKGTAFGLDEAATTAGAVVAAGVKPGKELEGVLTTVADTATIAGTSMSDMGTIFGSVAARGKLQGDDMMQLTSKGVPVLQFLAKHYGITAKEASVMVSKGQVDFKNFAAAMKENIGGAAQASGKTFSGAFANIKAALGRIGANLLSGVFSQLAPLLSELTDRLGALEDAAKPIGEVLGKQFAKIVPLLVSGLIGLVSAVGKIVAWMIKWRDIVGPTAVGLTVLSAGLGVLAIRQEAMAAGGFLKWLVSILKMTKLWTAAQAVLNVVMSANPIGLVIVAIAALVAGLTVFFTKTKLGQKIWAGFVGGMKTAAQAVVGWFKNSFVPFFTKTIPNAFRAVINFVKTNWQVIAGLILLPFGGSILIILKYRNQILAVFKKILGYVTGAFRAGWSKLSTILAAPISKARAVIGAVLTAIGNAFRALGKVFRSVYNGWIKPVVQLFGAIVKWLAGKIIAVQLKLIRAAWSAMANLVRSAYNTIIKPAINAYATAGKWLWNKALKPAIAAIKAAWHGLGVSIRTVYNTIVKPIINAFAAAGKWLWQKVLRPQFLAIRAGWKALGSLLKSVYNGTIKVVLGAFGKATGTARSFASKAFGGVRSAWSSTSKHLSNVFHGAMTKTFSAFKKAGGGMKSAFGIAVSGIGTAWGKLSELAKKPIHFIIDSVINKGLIKGFNSLAKTFGTKQMKWLPLPFNKGGIYPGYTPGRDIGLAAVSGGEPIMRPEFGRAVGHNWVDKANYIARTGGVAGVKKWMGAYASGGIVKPTRSGRQNASYPGHSGIDFFGNVGDPILAATAGRITYTGSGRGYGNAIFQAAANGLQMVYGHTSAILAKVGQTVQAGQQIGRVGYSGNVRPPGPAGAHLHFEIAPGGGFARSSNRDATQKWLGGSGLVGKIIGAVKGAVSAIGNFDPTTLLKGAVTKVIAGAKWLSQTPFGQLAAKVPVVLADRAIQYAKDKFTGLFAGDGVSASWSGGGVGSLGKDQLNNAATIIKTAKSLGFGQRGAIIGLMTAMQESTLRNLSGGDRDSVGLFQQRAPWGSFADRHNPARSAAMFYQGGHGGQPGLKSKNWKGLPLGVAAQQVQVSAFPDAYNKWEGLARQLVGKGYASGTRSATAGLHAIAEHGPELVMSRQTRLFRGGEQVATAGQTANLIGGPQQISGHLKITGSDAYIEGVVERTAKKAAVSF